MNVSSSSTLILCYGYSTSDYEPIRDHLISSGFFSVLRKEDTGNTEESGFKDVDIILIGFADTSEEIVKQVQRFRGVYPEAVIIRCICNSSDSEISSPESMYDGDYLLDLHSPLWGYTLVGIIFQALKVRDQQHTYIDMGDDFYHQIFEKNPIPLAVSIPDTGLFIEVNESFLQTYGYQREEVIGKSSFDLNLFVSKEERDNIIISCTEQYPARDKEAHVRTKDNKILIVLFSADIIYLHGRKLYLTTIKDISALKEIKRELNKNNRFIKEILSSISEGIIVYDSNLKYRVWNHHMEILTGISGKNIVGRPVGDFDPKLQGDDIPLLIRKAFAGITSTSADIFFEIRETGKTGWISIIYTPYKDSTGKITGVIATVRDISQRKKVEKSIIAHETQLRSIIDTVPVWITCIDSEGKITVANSLFSSSLGLTPDLVEGRLFEDFYFSPRFNHHKSLIIRALSGREVPFNEEMDDPDAPLKKKYLRGRYSPLRGPNGEVNGVVCVIIDITDIKIAHRTIEQINSKLNLLSSITRHDILNTLTAVLGYLACAEEEDNPKLLNTYIKKANMTALLIKEQIEFSRDYQDLGVKEPVLHNARDVFFISTRGLNMNNIVVETSLDDLEVYADPLLERVIYNLVDNALRYGETITQISSYWYQSDDHAIWVISDNGKGIAEGMKERIFKKGVGHNTGLGLFLAREILDITNLSISETGTEGKGARFEIRIPHGFWKKNPDR